MIKIVIFDFDGCFTDGTLEAPHVNAKDTWALKKLKESGVRTAILTRARTPISNPLILERIDEIIYCESKLGEFESLLRRLGLTAGETAFIGDDEADLPVLERVGLSAAPSDAMEVVRSRVHFVASRPGGAGAVREFVDEILKRNARAAKPVVAVVGARAGSTRCPNKNGRDFGLSESLVTRKLKILGGCKLVDKIIFSSDSTDYNTAAEAVLRLSGKPFEIELRPGRFSTSELSGKDFHLYLSRLAGEGDIFLYAHPVTPFISSEQIDGAIRRFKNSREDRLATFSKSQHFTFDDDGAVNFQLGSLPRSQDLPEWFVPTFGICLIENKLLRSSGALLGDSMIKLNFDRLASIDIDDRFDFATAKLLNENNVLSESDLEKYLDKSPPQVLDCTIRDGGYRNNWEFTEQEALDLFTAVSDAGIEWFEAGFRSPRARGGGDWLYTSEDALKRLLGAYKGNSAAKLAVMLKVGDFSASDIPRDSLADLFRLLISGGQFTEEHNQQVLEACLAVREAGKTLAINIPHAHQISDGILEFFSYLNDHEIKPDIVYLADTIGAMNTSNIVQGFRKVEGFLRSVYGSAPALGFHAHNNAGDALLKTLFAIDKIHGLTMVDSCIAGMGRGVGNVRTEELIVQLNRRGKLLLPRSVLEAAASLSSQDYERIMYLIAGENGIHPNKIMQMIQDGVSVASLFEGLND